MLLSIVMMIKNESEFLKKTLESLKEIHDSISTELIIIDTGSEDNSLEIAKKYTDKVYTENWNGNFADMRNKSISYAKGDWILILDADEVLIDSKNMIKFFDDGIYKRYNSASLKLKNLYERDKSNYGYISIIRLFKNEDLQFIGAIHEQPTYKEPVYSNVAEFEHYGYIFDDDKKKVEKLKRNETLLLKELNKKPNDPYIRYQLCQNLLAEGKLKEAQIQCEKSLEIYKRYDVRAVCVYEKLIRIYTSRKKFLKGEKLCKEYIVKDRKNIDIYYFLGVCQINQCKYKESIDSFKRYLYLIDNYDISTQYKDFTSECNTINLKEDALIKMILAYSELKMYQNIIDIFENIKTEDNKIIIYNYFIDSLIKLKKYEDLIKYENSIKGSHIDKKNFLNSLEYFISKSDENIKHILYNILSEIDGQYGTLNKIRLCQKINLETAVNILNCNEKENFYGSILSIIIKNGIDLYELLKDIDTIWIYKYFNYILIVEKDVSTYIYDYIMNSLNSFDIEKLRIYKILSELLITKVDLSDSEYKNMMYLYTMYSYQYIKLIYNHLDDDILMKHLGEGDRFVIRFRQIVEFDNKNSIEYIKQLKDISNQYNNYKNIINILIKEAQANLNKDNEFEELRKLFIYNIKNMIENNNMNSANTLVTEYLSNFNEDKEILNIKGVIEIMEGNLNSANITLKKALSLDINNEDLIYNINYLNEILIENKK